MIRSIITTLPLALLLLILCASIGISAPINNGITDIELTFYSPGGQNNFVVIEKSSQTLTLYQYSQPINKIRQYTCATGENPGSKLIQGDSRTPEGIYFITEIYEDKKITVFGSRAFHLDYPNVFDNQAGRRGDGIFIHGTNKKLKPYSTNGCVTLNNTDLDFLAPSLSWRRL